MSNVDRTLNFVQVGMEVGVPLATIQDELVRRERAVEVLLSAILSDHPDRVPDLRAVTLQAPCAVDHGARDESPSALLFVRPVAHFGVWMPRRGKTNHGRRTGMDVQEPIRGGHGLPHSPAM